MAEASPWVVDRVPTLTEVVEWQHRLPSQPDPAAVEPLGLGPPAAAEVSAEVLFELEQRIDSLFEARLREVLAPALARAADVLIREARQELAGALRDLVEESVTRALERRTHL